MSFGMTARSALRAGALFLAAALVATLPGSAAAQGRSMTIKLATATLNDAQHEWLKRFAAAVEKNTNGRIKAEIFPASQLGSIPRMIEGTQLGSIQIWIGPPEFLVGVDQRFELLSAPGVFQNDQQAAKTIADPEFSKAFLAIGANKGLIGASMFLYGPVAFAMRTPFRTLADLRGKKIRVLASPFQTEQIARLGGTGVPLTLADVLPALQQGTIDGTLASVTVFTTLQYQEAAKYMTETAHAYIFSIAMVSKRWFDGLPAELQAQVMSAAKQAGAETTPWASEFFASQHKVWAERGGETIVLPPAEKAELMAKMAPIGDDIVKTKPVLKPLWEQMVATAKRSN
ncbi:MAG TPA: TRAP transporter substrate-binding protein [Xanthobacteraceae bacterium]|jgi:TRAP-type C4-dicarboxylate transport system substrate-binding protein|nr:TRAP transporter substrate-binding protein [Xanthobacteraceae bacterium]